METSPHDPWFDSDTTVQVKKAERAAKREKKPAKKKAPSPLVPPSRDEPMRAPASSPPSTAGDAPREATGGSSKRKPGAAKRSSTMNALLRRAKVKEPHDLPRHMEGYLGRRVMCTHCPSYDKAHQTLVGRSGVVVEMAKGASKKKHCMYNVIFDDGRKVEVKRKYLSLDDATSKPVDIHLKASGLKVMDL